MAWRPLFFSVSQPESPAIFPRFSATVVDVSIEWRRARDQRDGRGLILQTLT
jgi:hypothetical protein